MAAATSTGRNSSSGEATAGSTHHAVLRFPRCFSTQRQFEICAACPPSMIWAASPPEIVAISAPTGACRWQDQKNKPPGASSAFKFADLLNSAKSKAAGANERRKKRRQRKGLQEQAADNLGAVNAMR